MIAVLFVWYLQAVDRDKGGKKGKKGKKSGKKSGKKVSSPWFIWFFLCVCVDNYLNIFQPKLMIYWHCLLRISPEKKEEWKEKWKERKEKEERERFDRWQVCFFLNPHTLSWLFCNFYMPLIEVWVFGQGKVKKKVAFTSIKSLVYLKEL